MLEVSESFKDRSLQVPSIGFHLSILFKPTHDGDVLYDFIEFRSPEQERFLKISRQKIYAMVEKAEKCRQEQIRKKAAGRDI